ncbi:MAG: cation diffusion facilitator family transporter [Acidiferrobacterales bacterium]|nr:cation diffusion facilitator family transporter [Acidiferrobacterales bacterium]
MHVHQAAGKRRLLTALTLTLTFAAVEAMAGWWSGSLALLGDASHMVTDAVALGLAAMAAWIATLPPSARHSYGLGRAEVVAALGNGLFMLVVVISIVVEAIERLRAPQPVLGGAVMIVAAIGLAINISVAYTLRQDEQTLNVRGALLHVMGDLLGSIAALVAGAVIYLTAWTPIDPILSLFICALILLSSVYLIRDALHVIMEGVPAHLDLHEVGRALAKGHSRIDSVHDLHIWTLSSGLIALSAHVVIDDMRHWDGVLQALSQLLRERFAIEHVTLQPETATYVLKPLRKERIR